MEAAEDTEPNSLTSKLETFAAVWYMCLNVYGAFILPFLFILLIVINKYSIFFIIAYILWIWYIDTTPEQGGRRNKFIQNLKLWVHFKNYFPITLDRDEFFKLSAKKNYLFCYFPHGIAGVGNFSAFGTMAGGFNELFPNHKPYCFSSDSIYKVPLYREYLLSFGFCKATAPSVKWVLSNKSGGNAGILAIGDPLESEYVHPNGRLWFLLRNKKGFVKLAIKNGTPLVPVIGFGELDVVEKPDIVLKSKARIAYEWFKSDKKIIPTLKESLVPKRRPINVIVGKPIDITQVPNPSPTEIDFVHRVFIYRLTELFEKHKYTYLSDPDNTHLMLY